MIIIKHVLKITFFRDSENIRQVHNFVSSLGAISFFNSILQTSVSQTVFRAFLQSVAPNNERDALKVHWIPLVTCWCLLPHNERESSA